MARTVAGRGLAWVAERGGRCGGDRRDRARAGGLVVARNQVGAASSIGRIVRIPAASVAVSAATATDAAKMRIVRALPHVVTKTPERNGAAADADIAARKMTLSTRPCRWSGVIAAW